METINIKIQKNGQMITLPTFSAHSSIQIFDSAFDVASLSLMLNNIRQTELKIVTIGRNIKYSADLN